MSSKIIHKNSTNQMKQSNIYIFILFFDNFLKILYSSYNILGYLLRNILQNFQFILNTPSNIIVFMIFEKKIRIK